MGSDGVHVLLRLLEGDAGFKSAHNQEPVEVVVDLFRLEDQGYGELRLLAIVNARALHADDDVGGSIQLQSSADDIWISAELDPQFVRKDNDVIAAGYALFRQKVAAHEEWLTYHLEHAVGRLIATDVLRIVFGGQVEVGAGPGAKILEDGVLLLSSRGSRLRQLHCDRSGFSTTPSRADRVADKAAEPEASHNRP